MRIHKKVKNFFTVFIALIFFFNSSGYSIYLHHCTDNDSNEFSFYVEKFNCDHEKASHCCEHEKSGKACENKDSEHFIQKNDCCSTNNEYVKIEEDYTSKFTNINIKISEIEIFEVVFAEAPNIPNYQIQLEKLVFKEPLFGFDRTISLHQLKLDIIS